MNLAFPPRILILVLEMYLAPRAVKMGNAVSNFVQVYNSMVAGCTFAVGMAKIYLKQPSDRVAQAPEGVAARCYVDDCHLRGTGATQELLELACPSFRIWSS